MNDKADHIDFEPSGAAVILSISVWIPKDHCVGL